ncbi:OTOGL [Branchiostoma lanceolatum]|uniref:OTOGL protein n=1 Tax=Branchiostoma lanceolatum TaxID=7740 RepID=A0A8J9YQR3_BRALA|nr:OTOGL [Branchiostoma lanceolatum]
MMSWRQERRFLAFVLICVLLQVIAGYTAVVAQDTSASPHFCNETVTTTEEVVITKEQEDTCQCGDLYLREKDGWTLQYDKMVTSYGGPTGAAQAVVSQNAICYIYKAAVTQPIETFRTVAQCCDGWSGSSCDIRIPLLGYCYTTDACTMDTFTQTYQTAQVDYNNCCYQTDAVAWGPLGQCYPCQTSHLTNFYSAVMAYKTCVTWAGHHFRSFDGRSFSFRGPCPYSLSQDTDGLWHIIAQNINCDIHQTCTKALHIRVGNDHLHAVGNTITFNGEDLNISPDSTVSRNGITLKHLGDFVFLETTLGMRLKWDTETAVYITVVSDYMYKTRGLCGVYDYNTDNDFMTPAGTQAPYAAIFGNSWKMDEIGESCPDVAQLPHPCDASPDIRAEAENRCGKIHQYPFDQCHSTVEPDEYYDSCLYGYCLWQDPDSRELSMCTSLTAYSRECAQEHIIISWRGEDFCEKTCLNGKEYTECASMCPVSCQTAAFANLAQCKKDCVSGCQCPEGTYLDEGQCVLAEECPCYHHRERFTTGDVIKQRCNECICMEGRWICSEDKCPGTCIVFGDPHYITFDQKFYTFQGKCEYTLVEDFMDGKLLITSQNEPCGSSGGVSCTKSVTVTHHMTTVTLKRGGAVTVDGRDTAIPFRNQDIYVKRASSIVTVLEGFGFRIMWDNINRAYITLDTVYSNKVRGLCGTFNWNQHDDFTTPEGDLETNAVAFANKFKLHVECLDATQLSFHPCDTYTQMRDFAVERCAIIFDFIFQSCHIEVDMNPYYDSCLYDVCGCEDTNQCLCSAVATYATECARSGVVVDWRQHELVKEVCVVQCTGGQLYKECMDSCGRGCSDLVYEEECLLTAEEVPCVAGCNCPVTIYTCYVRPICEYAVPVWNPGLTKNQSSRLETIQRRACRIILGKKYTHYSEALTQLGLPTLESRREQLCKKFGLKLLKSAFRDWLPQSRGEASDGMALNDDGLCVMKSMCPCKDGGKAHAPGSSIKKGCNTCLCENGIFNCSDHDCPDVYECPRNLIYRVDVSPCPLTCDNMVEDEYCNLFKQPGCGCPDGMVLDEDYCVLPENCPCHHGMQKHQRGETITKDCNTCVCKGRHWECSNNKCAGVCIASGDPHYITFDGKSYSFQGGCNYILSKDMVTHEFTITAENVPCGTSGVTCTKSVTVDIGGTIIRLVRGRRVTVNDVPILPPKAYNGTGLVIHKSGIYVIVSSVMGLEVKWDGQTRVYVKLDPVFKGKVGGLCGNYDGDAENDFTARQGGLEHVAYMFADTWRVSTSCTETEPSPLHPCKISSRETWAKKMCGVLTGPMFEPCHSTVPYEMYYTWCVYDTCGCDYGGFCECLCTAISLYAQMCSDNGIYIRWRSQEMCPMQCDNGHVYEACGPVCQDTCRDLGETPPWYCERSTCVEGCFCPEGYVDDVPTCKIGEFTCENGRCLPYGWMCDGQVDCENGEDEKDCVYECEVDEFKCESGACIKNVYRCDGITDCRDLSDEQECPPPACEENEFTCKNGRCIPGTFVCDGDHDCGFDDNSDEEQCAFNCDIPHEFFCQAGICLPLTHRCDGHDDCGDMSDEYGCISMTFPTTCAPEEFVCDTGDCLPADKLCDGQPDCPDGSDEKDEYLGCPAGPPAGYPVGRPVGSGCPAGPRFLQKPSPSTGIVTCAPAQFQCPDGTCIDISWLCDGSVDCEDGTDELDCPTTTLPPTTTTSTVSIMTTSGVCDDTMFVCSILYQCIPLAYLCDGEVECEDGTDEVNCTATCLPSQYICNDGKCLDPEFLCDGVPQCEDSSDESVHICVTTCPNITCDDGRCITHSDICDGEMDCSQGEDEQNCITSAPTTTSVPMTTTVTYNMTTLVTTPTAGPCPEYTCFNGKCIDYEQVCNQVYNCNDGVETYDWIDSDEYNCGGFNEWSPWGSCSSTCGPGVQRRYRLCSAPPPPVHDPLRYCSGESIEEMECFLSPCEVDPEWGSWERWSECTSGCHIGFSVRVRECRNKVGTGEQECVESADLEPTPLELKACNRTCGEEECEDQQEYRTGEDCLVCPLTCIGLVQGSQCVDTTCSAGCYCPEGYYEHHGMCVVKSECPCLYNGQEYNNGQQVVTGPCHSCTCVEGELLNCVETQPCNVDCGWSEWTEWGLCVGVCETTSIQWSYRTPDNPPKFGNGAECVGENRRNQTCYTGQCEACQEYEFRCDNGNCVPGGPTGVVCDGTDDCGDDSDEDVCGGPSGGSSGGGDGLPEASSEEEEEEGEGMTTTTTTAPTTTAVTTPFTGAQQWTTTMAAGQTGDFDADTAGVAVA